MEIQTLGFKNHHQLGHSYGNSHSAKQLITSEIKSTGYIVLKNLNFASGMDLEKFASAFCSSFIDGSFPGRGKVAETSKVSFAAPGTSEVLLHSEFYARASAPEIGWFWCQKPAQTGGESLLCDGIALWEALPEDSQLLFEQKKLRLFTRYQTRFYQEKYGTFVAFENEIKNHPEVSSFKPLEDGSVEVVRFVSAIRTTTFQNKTAFLNGILPVCTPGYPKNYLPFFRRTTFEDETPIDETLVKQIQERADGLAQTIRLESNDLLIFDNSRFLHGRRAFEGERKVYTLFGFKNFN